MKLEQHIHILKNLRIPLKTTLIRILWTIFEEHHNEIKNIEDFIKRIRWKPEQIIEPVRK